MVGGRRASFDGFNRALDMKRPIGSLAKPMVYLAALQSGRYTPASVVMDEPIEFKLESGDVWKPNNYDKKVHGPVTLVRGLTQSYNLATVNLGLDVGLGPVAKTYVQLGLDEAPPKYPSILLGTAQLNPVEVAQMYNTLANGGFRSPLRAVRAVIDEQGKALKAPELEVTEAAPAEAVYTLNRMLIEVFERGTARPAKKALPPGLVVAGKTGTSNDYRDSWFAGFSGGARDRGVDGSRRQRHDRPHRHDRRIAGVDTPDGLDLDDLVRPADARSGRGSLDRVLLGAGDVAVLFRLGRQNAVRSRDGAEPEPRLPAEHHARGGRADAAPAAGRTERGRRHGAG